MNRRVIQKEFLDEVNAWTLNWPEIIQLTGLKHFTALDIGGAAGATLVALGKLKLTKHSWLVEPYWQAHSREVLPTGQDTPAFYEPYGVELLTISGDDPLVPYKEADLVIKTYNPFIDWTYVLTQTRAKWIITDTYWYEKLEAKTKKRLTVVVSFNNTSTSRLGRKVREDINAYHLIRIK